MASHNHVEIMGNLGADPEVKQGDNTTIARLRIATTEKWRDKASGEQKERTDWHTAKLFGKTAEVAEQYLRKGRACMVVGRLRTDEYTDKAGKKQYATYIHVDRLILLGDGQQRDSGGDTSNDRGRGQRNEGAPPSRSRGRGTQSQQTPPPPDDDGFDDDDIPF